MQRTRGPSEAQLTAAAGLHIHESHGGLERLPEASRYVELPLRIDISGAAPLPLELCGSTWLLSVAEFFKFFVQRTRPQIVPLWRAITHIPHSYVNAA